MGKNVLFIETVLYWQHKMISVKKLSRVWALFYYSALCEKNCEKKQRYSVFLWHSKQLCRVFLKFWRLKYLIFKYYIVCNIRYNTISVSVPCYSHISVCFRLYLSPVNYILENRNVYPWVFLSIFSWKKWTPLSQWQP